MANKKLHGLHNAKACNLLIDLGNGEFNDWIVTTAFYSALQLVHHHIFPLSILKRVFSSFDVYYCSEYYNFEVAKHTVTRELVKSYMPRVSGKYNWLFKECYNARYKHYKINGVIAKTAKEYLDEIMIHVDK